MRLEEIAPEESVFIDSNIFIYHFTGTSEECSHFLSRCERKDLSGVTSTNVLLEVLHRLMLIEAVNKKLLAPLILLRNFKKNPGW